MKPKISIITLGVADLDKSKYFYQHALSLPLSKNSNESIAFFELHGCWLALFDKIALAQDAGVRPVENLVSFSGITLAQNVTSKKAVDKQIEEAKVAGAVITKPPQDTFWGGYSGYFKDLDGYLWEIAYNPFFNP